MDLTSLVDDIRQTAAVSSLPSGQAEAECSEAVAAIPSAVKAVQKILQLTGDTLPEICRHIESVPTQVALKSAFGRLNDTMRFFFGVTGITSGPSLDRRGRMRTRRE